MISKREIELYIWNLLTESGPKTTSEISRLIKRDPEFGYLALKCQQLESGIRQVLLDGSSCEEPYFILSFGYKWSVISSRSRLDTIEKNSIAPRQPWLVLGQGQESVYAIVSTQDLAQSRYSISDNFPIKIGRTSRTVSSRLRELQTGNHGVLRVAIIIKTNNSYSLESFLHSSFAHRKIDSKGSQSEWFFTNFESILNLVSQFVTQNITQDQRKITA